MKLKIMLALAILSISTSTWAATITVRCSVGHYLRLGGTEIRSTGIGFRNFDRVNSATVVRLVIYDLFGIKVHESVAGTHPLNTDIPPPAGPLDISTVPPNANYYLRTNHIWGNASIPDLGDGIDGNTRGISMTAVVVIAKPGNADLISVGRRGQFRMLADGVEGLDLSGDSAACS